MLEDRAGIELLVFVVIPPVLGEPADGQEGVAAHQGVGIAEAVVEGADGQRGPEEKRQTMGDLVDMDGIVRLDQLNEAGEDVGPGPFCHLDEP